jgi:hypothetical protein
MNTNNNLLGYGYTSDEEFIANQKKDTVFSMKNVADIINNKSYGRTKLYELLLDLGYLEENRIAREQFVEQGYFINESKLIDKGGFSKWENQVIASLKGLELIKKLVKEQTK